MATTSPSTHINQPAPAPIRAHTHEQQRLFLGPLPAASLASDRVNKARRRYWNLGSNRRSAGNDAETRRRRSSDDAGLVQETTSPRGLHFSLPAFRRSRSESVSAVEEEEFDTTITQPDGSFFTIGQEFRKPTERAVPAEGDHGDDPILPPVIFVNEAIVNPTTGSNHLEATDEQETSAHAKPARPPAKPISRPSLYPRTTTDRLSYQTARSQVTNRNDDVSFSAILGSTGRTVVDTPATMATTKTGTTDFFSARSEVIVSSSDDDDDDDDDDRSTIKTTQKHPESIKSNDPVLRSEYMSAPVVSTSPDQVISPTAASSRFSTKLRSALRNGSNRFKSLEEEGDPADYESKSWGKKRTVQFPLSTSSSSENPNFGQQPSTSIRGLAPSYTGSTSAHPFIAPSPSTSASDPTLCSPDEQMPAAPREVLARTGSSVAGTSAGVVEAARKKKKREKEVLGGGGVGGGGGGASSEVHVEVADVPMGGREEEDVDDDPRKIILRDRMLVAVGRNSHPHLTGYNEREARRKPSERVKAIEEYLVVYRKGWVELHKEWSTPIGRTFRKHKRLCFAIPLLSTVTTFSMFSRRDLSFALCLDNVILREEVEKADEASPHHQPGSSSPHTMEVKSRRRKVVNRMKKTKEFKWVQERAEKNRSLVFVFIGRERTRMLDWCWEIWKELGGQIPEQLRVHIPIFESVIDLPRPREDYAGSPATLQAFSRSRILLDVFTTLRSQLPDYDEFVKREMARSGQHSLRLELAWETGMHLDWIPSFAEWSVEDQERRWAVLSGLTMDELSDGMQLSEPCAIEGILHRLSGAKTVSGKRRVYVHTQSGYLLSTSTRHAQAPLPPYPHSVEDAVMRDAYFADEQIRTAHNMLHSDGLIDFRSIVRIIPPKDSLEQVFDREGPETGKGAGAGTTLETTLRRLTDSQFVVVLSSNEIVLLEADGQQVADEWVRRLTALCKYWTHRQRVE
ncbi:hypothetical protein QFC22_003066 [Naganishia vaughanmartiniae]|uniref:Uncharacterized protein n=1 Tax=Naganishia vaughanmartiniae TaxID=1424756 RepID=A0ACC2XBQ2_9TREE|nr:hypothetical protein QFC22_003066 [Naganishia vaughanmartiniae]